MKLRLISEIRNSHGFTHYEKITLYELLKLSPISCCSIHSSVVSAVATVVSRHFSPLSHTYTNSEILPFLSNSTHVFVANCTPLESRLFGNLDYLETLTILKPYPPPLPVSILKVSITNSRIIRHCSH